jgi:hypothetical protein
VGFTHPTKSAPEPFGTNPEIQTIAALSGIIEAVVWDRSAADSVPGQEGDSPAWWTTIVWS